MKFCRCVASLYPHTDTNFGWFILIFHRMALIFLGVLSVCTISSSRVLWLHRQCSPELFIIRLGLRAMLESCHKLQSKPKAVPQFKDSVQLIWSALPEIANENALKDYRKRLHACISQRWTCLAYNVTIHTADTNRYISLSIIWCDSFFYENIANFVIN